MTELIISRLDTSHAVFLARAALGRMQDAMSLPDDAVGAGKVELTGNKTEMTTIFDLFDKFEPMENFKLPPVSKVSVQHP